MPIQAGVPVAGYYAHRLGHNTFRIPVHVYFGAPRVRGERLDRSPRWCIIVDGVADKIERDPVTDSWHWAPLDIWDWWPDVARYPISKAEYRYMNRLGEWAREHAPGHPAANPSRRINIRTLEPLF